MPNELIWVMEKLGFEWPDIDEDEVRRGATIVRTFGTEMETVIQAVDRHVNGELAGAMRGQTGPAMVSAWNTNRSQNLQKLIDLMPPVAGAMDVAAVAVTATKVTVIVDVTSTLVALVAMLTNPVTAADAGPMLLIKKRLLNAVVDIAVEHVVEQLAPLAIQPLVEQLPSIVSAVLDAPAVESVAGDTDEFYADLQALEQAQSTMEMHQGDLEGVIPRFTGDISSLNIGGD